MAMGCCLTEFLQFSGLAQVYQRLDFKFNLTKVDILTFCYVFVSLFPCLVKFVVETIKFVPDTFQVLIKGWS